MFASGYIGFYCSSSERGRGKKIRYLSPDNRRSSQSKIFSVLTVTLYMKEYFKMFNLLLIVNIG